MPACSSPTFSDIKCEAPRREYDAISMREPILYFLQDCAALLEERCDKTISFINASVNEWVNESHLVSYQSVLNVWHKFLSDPESPISINPDAAYQQQRLGMLICLASAARDFGQSGVKANIQLLVVRGVFAFLNYASKHWAEHVLSYIGTHPSNSLHDALVLKTISNLAKNFQSSFQSLTISWRTLWTHEWRL